MGNICGYIRVSTLKQKMDGVSLEAQKNLIINHALMLELVESEEEIKFYIDEGYSAKSLERPQMKQLLYDIKQNKVDVLFCYDISRISRDIFDSTHFLQIVEKYGVKLKCLYDQIRNNTASDRLGTNMKLIYNQYEREKVVERTNDGLKFIAESGRYPCGGNILFGYRRTKTKDLVIYETEAKLVRDAYQMALDNYSIKEIKDYLNEMQSEKPFSNATVKTLLTNPRYTGIMEYKGKVYDNLVPKIIENEVFAKVKNMLKNPSYKHSEKYYFEGVLICANCGKKLSETHGTSHTGEKHYYYYCRRCKKSVSQKNLEKKISVLDYKGSGNNKEELKKLKNKKYALQRRINHIREEYIDKQINERSFVSLIIPLEDELNVINVSLERGSSKYKTENYVDMITNSDKKNYIQSNFRKIVINPDSKRIVDIAYK